MSMIQQIAEWAYRQPAGVTCHDVAAEFGVTAIHASMQIGQILREPRFTARASYEYSRRTGQRLCRLHVDQVRPPAWQKTRVVGTNSHGQTVSFASLNEAQAKGGFSRDCISRCIKGIARHHGGYRWVVAQPGEAQIKHIELNRDTE